MYSQSLPIHRAQRWPLKSGTNSTDEDKNNSKPMCLKKVSNTNH
jgi:hypothetical protein